MVCNRLCQRLYGKKVEESQWVCEFLEIVRNGVWTKQETI